MSACRSFCDMEERTRGFQSYSDALRHRDRELWVFWSKETQRNDSSYLAYSLACALVPHTIERVPGIQSRLWAACQRCRPELETPHRSAGHLDARATRSQTHLSASQMSLHRCIIYFLSSVCLPIIGPCSEYEA